MMARFVSLKRLAVSKVASSATTAELSDKSLVDGVKSR